MKRIDHGLDAMIRNAAKLDGQEVSIGFHGDDYYPDGTPVVDVAVYNEYGTRNAPARPFMATTATRYAAETKAAMAKRGHAVMQGHETATGAMQALGSEYAEHIRTTIRMGPWVPNAPSTLRQKQGDDPLIDTKVMIHSIGFRVA